MFEQQLQRTAMTPVKRKEIERRRRQQMKVFCAKLASLIPKQHYPSSVRKMNNEFDILDAAVSYIKELKERVEQQEKQRRSAANLMATIGGGGTSTSAATSSGGVGSSEEASNEEMVAAAPVVLARFQPQDGSCLDVALISNGVRRPPLMVDEVIAVLEEEGAEVLNATLSIVDGRQIFCSVHSRAFSSRIGIDVSRVTERLRALV